MRSKVTWKRQVDDFLRYRTQLGRKDTTYQFYLSKFARYADERHATHITVRLAVGWIRDFRGDDLRARLASQIRVFARFCKRTDPRTEILPNIKFRRRPRRRVPHIFTELELTELQGATKHLQPENGLRPSTYRALFGLLAASGLRTAEAIRLTVDDVNLDEGILSIRESKGHKSRFVPLHPTAAEALRCYARKRDELFPIPLCDRFFVTDRGKAVAKRAPDWALRYLAKKFHWPLRGDYAFHRCRDLRHTFIVRNIIKGLHKSQEFWAFSLALATYVGHEDIKYTYWYMTGVPELMALTGRRFHEYAKTKEPV